MKVGIIAAMPEELKALLEVLEDGQKHLSLGRVYHTGHIGRHQVVLVESGIGKVMSAMTVAVLADRYKVDVIINTGSAGALAQGLAVGDVVLAERLAYHDVDVTAFGYDYGQMAGQPLYYETSKYLLGQMKEVLAGQGLISKAGLIVTGDSFIANQDKVSAIREYFPDVLAVEMEGAAVAQAAQAAGKPCLVVRAVSDTADQAASISFDQFIQEAGRRSAQALIALLKNLD